MLSLMLIGKRWFRKGPGTTYHSVAIYIDGKFVHKIPYAYGYGSSYEESAAQWLEANGYFKRQEHTNGGCQTLWQWAADNAIRYSHSATDVLRKKDL